MERIYRRDILDFVTVATEFCKQVEQCSGSERGEFTTVMQRLLPMVYLKAAFIDEIEEGVGYVDAVVTESDYEFVRTQIAAIMRDADDYLDVFVEQFRYSDAPVVCTVSESLADVYQALRNMVEAFHALKQRHFHRFVYLVAEGFDHVAQGLIDVGQRDRRSDGSGAV